MSRMEYNRGILAPTNKSIDEIFEEEGGGV